MKDFNDFISRLNAPEVKEIIREAHKLEDLVPVNAYTGSGYSSEEIQAMGFGVALALLQHYHVWNEA